MNLPRVFVVTIDFVPVVEDKQLWSAAVAAAASIVAAFAELVAAVGVFAGSAALSRRHYCNRIEEHVNSRFRNDSGN